MMRVFLFVVLLFCLLTSGCGQVSAPQPDQPPIPESTVTSPASVDGWTIRMTHSGGIMGLSRSIEVSSDGKFIVTDNRANKTVSGKLVSDDLSKFNELLMSIENRPTAKPNGAVCADCFGFSVEILNPHFKTAAENAAWIVKEIAYKDPRFVGLAAFVTDFDAVTALASEIKKKSSATILAGNAHPSIAPEDFLYENSPFDLVVRGEDLLASTGRQILLARLFGRTAPPRFLHHPIIRNEAGVKLSKKDRATGLAEMRAAGMTADDVVDLAKRLSGVVNRDT